MLTGNRNSVPAADTRPAFAPIAWPGRDDEGMEPSGQRHERVRRIAIPAAVADRAMR